MYCHLRPADAIAYPIFNIFWGFKSELQANLMPSHLETLWGTTLMPHRRSAMDWDKTKL